MFLLDCAFFVARPGRLAKRLSAAALVWRSNNPIYVTACGLLTLLLVVLVALPASAALPQVKRVMVIGCDGFGSVGFTPSNTPVLHRLMREGAWTLHARGVLPTVSSPNWASMIMGAGPEQHGVTSNEWETNKFEIAPIAVGSGGIFPTIFGVMREQRPSAKIAVVHDWDGFARLIEPKAPDLIENVKGSPATAKRAIQVLEELRPDFLFIHFDDVDHAGHTFGWKSPEYFQAADAVDKLIGDLMTSLEKSGLAKDTLVIMTADHGGKGKSHGSPTMDELEIPWVLHGPGVAAGHEIKEAVNTYDLAATIAWVFGLKAPSCWIGKPIIEAFESKATAAR
jgi:predicted AlkP superfamily pyrophosphatase or phosphodiesterase